MAYTPGTLENVYSQIDGVWNIFRYISTDSVGSITAAGYITDYKQHHIQVGDFVIVVNQSTPLVSLCQVNSVSSTANTATLALISTGAGGTFTSLTVTGASLLQGSTTVGSTAASLFGVYGTTAVSQRTSTLQITTNVVTSASFGTLQVAQVQEIQNTLTGMGLWKGS